MEFLVTNIRLVEDFQIRHEIEILTELHMLSFFYLFLFFIKMMPMLPWKMFRDMKEEIFTHIKSWDENFKTTELLVREFGLQSRRRISSQGLFLLADFGGKRSSNFYNWIAAQYIYWTKRNLLALTSCLDRSRFEVTNELRVKQIKSSPVVLVRLPIYLYALLFSTKRNLFPRLSAPNSSFPSNLVGVG